MSSRAKPRLDLERFLPYRLDILAESVSRGLSRLYKEPYGLGVPEWRVLAHLGQYAPITAKAIGAHSRMHKTKVSRAVRSLEERRWLKRREDEGDRRLEHLELTREGKRAYEKIAREAQAYERELLEVLGEEGIAALTRGLEAVERGYGR